MAPDGITWVAVTWGHRVVALDANGAIVQTIGAETVDTGDDPARVDEAGGRFFGPRAIAVSDDAIYVVDTGNERVQFFTREGAFVDAWGGYGSGADQLIEPVGIALGPDGNVYVADSGNARISIFTPDGEPVAQWPVSAWPAPAPGGLPPAFQPYLAFDADGNLYATASNAGQVLVFDGEGKMISAVTDAAGERLTQPVGVAIPPDGVVLFTDVGRDAVLEYTPPRTVDLEELDQEDVGASPRP
jgi:DNA-binding beta-propeller fold protein YncE